jgi:hypothetical protein
MNPDSCREKVKHFRNETKLEFINSQQEQEKRGKFVGFTLYVTHKVVWGMNKEKIP